MVSWKAVLFFLGAGFFSLFAEGSSLDLEGVYPAVLTPLHEDFCCNERLLIDHCLDLLEKGCTGVTLFGTAGEGPSFSVEERVDVLRKLIAGGLDPKKIILGNGGSGVQDTVMLGVEAVAQGCAALLVTPPSFYKQPTDEGVLAYFQSIVRGINEPKLPVILYHIPQMSGVAISLEVIEKLTEEFPRVVRGIKESEGNAAFTRAILKRFPGFWVFAGSERQIMETVSLGGAGTICGIANLYPEWICSLYRQGKEGHRVNPASVEVIMDALGKAPFIPAAKEILAGRGESAWRCVRPPLTLLTKGQKEQLFVDLAEYERSLGTPFFNEPGSR